MTEHKIRTVYTREYLTSILIMFKDGYKDEIPDRIIHSDDLDNRYKVRTSWLAGVANSMERSHTVGILPNSVQQDVSKFFDWYMSEYSDRPGDQPNTKEDIEVGNNIICKVLESLGFGTKA